jgi:hypothetical protein
MNRFEMVRRITVAASMAMALLLCSCNSGLDNTKAQAIFKASDDFNAWKPKLSTRPGTFMAPGCAAFVTKDHVGEFMGDRFLLSDKGHQYFADPANDDWCYVGWPSCEYQLKLKPEVQAITDIRESGNDRVVEFTYKFPSYPGELAQCIPDPGTKPGKALFVKSGDGWKVTELK